MSQDNEDMLLQSCSKDFFMKKLVRLFCIQFDFIHCKVTRPIIFQNK